MISNRKNSLDPPKIEGWIWSPFLSHTIKSLSRFNPKEYPVDRQFLDKNVYIGPQRNPFLARLSTWACQTKKIRNVRAACLEAGKNASVLNLLISPSKYFELPFFGADFVTLPTGYLLALDLQPILRDDSLHTEHVWSKLQPIHDHWQSLLPAGGPLPIEAEKYFSPGLLWTRFPLGNKSIELIDNIIMPAYCDYLSLYLELLEESIPVSSSRSEILFEGQKSYMNYRYENDPARGMLIRFYGQSWSELYLRNILFDIS